MIFKLKLNPDLTPVLFQSHTVGSTPYLEAHVEPCQISKTERFVKIVIDFNYFCEILHLRCLTMF